MGQPPGLLVLPPVVPPVVALDLVAGVAAPQRKAVGEIEAVTDQDTSSEVTPCRRRAPRRQARPDLPRADARAGPRWRARASVP